MAIEILPPKGHIITLTMLAWGKHFVLGARRIQSLTMLSRLISSLGHVKSACSLLAKILRSRPIHATMFVALRFVEKTNLVLDILFMPEENELRSLIRYGIMRLQRHR